jgi:hypothetical protein
VRYLKKKECRKDGSARNTIGARYLPKNTVLQSQTSGKSLQTPCPDYVYVLLLLLLKQLFLKNSTSIFNHHHNYYTLTSISSIVEILYSCNTTFKGICREKSEAL